MKSKSPTDSTPRPAPQEATRRNLLTTLLTAAGGFAVSGCLAESGESISVGEAADALTTQQLLALTSQALNRQDLLQLTRQDVEAISSVPMRLAVVDAIIRVKADQLGQQHYDHNSHSNHEKYTQSIFEADVLEKLLDVAFGPAS
ncbi:hypothetical protein ACMHYB_23365 [Sorangium sp. So ce1128]